MAERDETSVRRKRINTGGTNQQMDSGQQANGSLGWFLEREFKYPVRHGNLLTPHYSGQEAFTVVADSIQGAKKSNDMIMWGGDPTMPVRRSAAYNMDHTVYEANLIFSDKTYQYSVWRENDSIGKIILDALAQNPELKVRLVIWYPPFSLRLMKNVVGVGGALVESDCPRDEVNTRFNPSRLKDPDRWGDDPGMTRLALRGRHPDAVQYSAAWFKKVRALAISVLMPAALGLYGCGNEHSEAARPGPHQEIALQGLTPAERGQNQPPTTPDSKPNSTTGVLAMVQDVSEKEIEQLFNQGKSISGFSPRRIEDLEQCVQWAEPTAPDEMSRGWYRVATTLHAIRLKTAEQYQQMLILYEAAARHGHYRAAMHLTVLYTTGGEVREGRYGAEPLKARMWINEGLRRGWSGALEWLSTAYHQGSAGYARDERESLKYLKLAADLGVPLAQYELGLYYENELNQIEKGDVLYECAGRQGSVSAASDKIAIIKGVQGFGEKALQFHQLAIMNGGEGGGNSALTLSRAFSASESSIQQELSTQPDTIREAAYMDLKAALNDGYDSQDIRREGNRFLRFPRLNEVLPLPPAQVTEWKGIYSAMSPDDAAYYQNPPPAEYYIDLVRQSGYLIGSEYLGNPLVPENQSGR